MTTNTGGPAFPVNNEALLRERGMTLRDYFAAKAMAGIWSNSEILNALERGRESEEIAMAAYEQADAMLKARKA